MNAVERARRVTRGVVCVLVLAVYGLAARSGPLEAMGGSAAESYYNLLAPRASMPSISPRTERPFLETVRAGTLVVDGAMGTQLYERGILYGTCFDELNVTKPELVAKVHDDFLRAGAQVIETNTFGANALRLEKYGLSARVRELNLAGVKVARAAAAGQAYVAGAIGPSGYFLGGSGEMGADDRAKVREVILEQARALVDANVDALLVETFRQTPELRVAVEAAVEAAEGRIPVIASGSLAATASNAPCKLATFSAIAPFCFSSRPKALFVMSPPASLRWQRRQPSFGATMVSTHIAGKLRSMSTC